MTSTKSRGLGKGLEALFGDVEINMEQAKSARPMPSNKTEKTGKNKAAGEKADSNAAGENAILFININDIKPNANQPRKQFDDEKIEELAKSIREHGIIQPVVVREKEYGYEIVAGERRWRAARKAELKQVPCIVRELTEEQNILFAIIENMQREDLNPIEEAEAISNMIHTFGLTQEEVSKSVGKSRPYITNSLRLLKLPSEIQSMVITGKLSSGHARAIVTILDKRKQLEIANLAAEGTLSVRQIERLAGEATPTKKRTTAKPREKHTDIIKVEEELRLIFGTRVNLNHSGKKGKIEIEYYSKDELDRLIDLLRGLTDRISDV